MLIKLITYIVNKICGNGQTNGQTNGHANEQATDRQRLTRM